MIHSYHTGYVLDASVVVKWFARQPEKDRAVAVACRSAYISGRFRIAVPVLCLIEVANALRYSPRAREADVAEAIDALNVLAFEIAPTDSELLKKANAIAWGYGVTVYDALYVALAEARGYPLITADDAFRKRMHGHSIVLALRDMDFQRVPGD